ncbi:hypothetical protein ACQKMV_04845 [Lysinibacillus sp. NPDC094403]|uniref:hypothetical protein n=1 Tax=Lysinibacillus sp. NPDC094403 TaxID=3390581 RepID=UPI003CFE1BB4
MKQGQKEMSKNQIEQALKDYRWMVDTMIRIEIILHTFYTQTGSFYTSFYTSCYLGKGVRGNYLPSRWSGATSDWSLVEEVWLNPEKPTFIQAKQKVQK